MHHFRCSTSANACHLVRKVLSLMEVISPYVVIALSCGRGLDAPSVACSRRGLCASHIHVCVGSMVDIGPILRKTECWWYLMSWCGKGPVVFGDE